MTVAVAVIATFNGWPFLVRGKLFFFPLPSCFLTRLLYRFERATFNSSSRNLRKKKSRVAGDHARLINTGAKILTWHQEIFARLIFDSRSFGYRISNILERNIILKEVQYQVSISSILLYVRSYPYPFLFLPTFRFLNRTVQPSKPTIIHKSLITSVPKKGHPMEKLLLPV